MPPIGRDEPLVREHLLHFLVTAENTRAFSDYIESEYLKRCFAETKILNGIGDQEAWYALLEPSEVKRLRDRVDLELLPTNPSVLGPDDPVAVDLAVKNVDELVAKIYHINTTAYYRRHGRDVSTDIDLDGLVPNHERTVTYNLPPLRRHTERFTFPELAGRGVYVIEFIGNGVSSRALVRKGQLRYRDRPSAAGHTFRIYDASGKWLKDATLWTAGREYAPDEDGEIVIPFAGQKQRRKIVLRHGGTATLWTWTHQPEDYTLDATIQVEHETLVEGEMCRILVRPRLSVSGAACDIGILEDVVLTIRSTDIDGTSAEKQFRELELRNDRETTVTFRVPRRLRTVSATLQGTVENLNSGQDETLTSSTQRHVNGIATTEKIENLFLRHTADGFFAELLGRNGEPLPDRPVHFEIKNAFVRDDVDVTLKTDASGRIALGPLTDIDWVRARGTEGTTETWHLPVDATTLHDTYDVAEGETLFLPWSLAAEEPQAAVSLLELRGGVPVRDCIEKVSITAGYLVIEGLETGDYRLTGRRTGVTMQIAVGEAAEGSTAGGLNRPGLQIADVEADEGTLRLHLLGVTPDTRVHVMATRFCRSGRGSDLIRPRDLYRPGVWRANEPESLYLSGRTLGDEYRYVMERKGERIFPGNMLTRPSLILNPWSPRETRTGTETSADGDAWRGVIGHRHPGRRGSALRTRGGESEAPGTFPTVAFLSAPSVVRANARPDDNGRVTLPLDDLGPGQQLHIYAVNAHSGAYRETALPERPEETRERRLVRYLDPASHFTQRKEIAVLRKGERLQIDDILSAEIEVYDSIDRVFSLFAALNGNPTLQEFGFLTRWPSLSDEEKRSTYAEYACHELDYFLHRKDPAFFNAVVKPYLLNKKDRTFMDDWLLGRAGESYLAPWNHARLNMAERVLLGQSLEGEHGATARHIKDLYDLVPPDPEQDNARFRAALRSRGLDAAESVSGLEGARKAQRLAEAPAVGRLFEDADASAAPMTPAPEGAAFKTLAEKPRAAGLGGVAKMEEAEEEGEGGFFGGARRENRRKEIDGLLDTEGFSMEKAFGDKTDGTRLARDRGRRTEVRQLYRKLGATREWVENNYYELPIAQQLAALIQVNGFWKDFAASTGGKTFLSPHVAEASRNLSEMVLALGSTGLPFEAAEHDTVYADGGLTLIAGNDLLVYHQQVRAAESVAEQPLVLVTQNFFARNDRYRYEDNERFDKFVTGDFEAGRVYGCQVVLTNPTSTRRKLELVTQVPAGSIPVLGGAKTRTRHLVVEPYATQTREYYFYFPAPGEFEHYPVHAAQAGRVVGYGDPTVFTVKRVVTEIDETSWEHISQFAADDAVLAFLDNRNVERLDLDPIAFRMRDKDMYRRVTDLLRKRHAYSQTLWAYSLYHKDTRTIREYLPHTPFAARCGRIVESPILAIDPVQRHIYEHKEYWPLVNPRVFRLGRERKILNYEFHRQYMSFLENLRYRARLTPDDRMTLVVYLFLQDRVSEALHFFDTLDPDTLDTRIQYDYMAAYAAFYREAPEQARAIAEPYADYPVERWRNLFAGVIAQCDEIAGEGPAVSDDEDRTQTQTQLADTEPRLAADIEGQEVKLEYANIDRVELNIYPMDIELLFSRRPFVKDVGQQFAMIRPNHTMHRQLDPEAGTARIEIPAAYRDRNVMIEAVAAGIRRPAAYYPNRLRVDAIEQYGQVKVTHQASEKALPRTYVKVYAQLPDGSTRFFKDGYTDLRGRFDYASLNTDAIQGVTRFAILVLNERYGAVVREAAPPTM